MTVIFNQRDIQTVFREGTYLTIVVNLPYDPQAITSSTKHTINY